MKQTEKSALSREYIINCAVNEFGKKGFASSSVNNICRDGDISKGKMYHYFDSKESLYFECVVFCLASLSSHLDTFQTDFEKSFEENLLRFFSHWQDFWKENPDMIPVIMESKILPPPSLARKLYDFRVDVIEEKIKYHIEKLLAPYVPKEDKERLRILADCLWVAMDYISFNKGAPKFMLNGFYDGFFSEQIELFETIVHMFLHVDLNKYN